MITFNKRSETNSHLEEDIIIDYTHTSEPNEPQFTNDEELIEKIKNLTDNSKVIHVICLCHNFQQHDTTIEKLLENFKRNLEEYLYSKTGKTFNIYAELDGEHSEGIGITSPIKRLAIGIRILKE